MRERERGIVDERETQNKIKVNENILFNFT